MPFENQVGDVERKVDADVKSIADDVGEYLDEQTAATLWVQR